MEPVAVDFADSRELYERAVPKRIGSDDAPVKIVVFSDFMCGGCAAFSLRERPRIMPWIERGEAQYIAYDFPLGGASSTDSSRPAPPAAPGTSPWPAPWTAPPTGPTRTGSTPTRARGPASAMCWTPSSGTPDEIGLDRRAFEQCLRSDRHADVVTANRMVGDQLGVNSTPTVLVNNRRVAVRPSTRWATR
jgi:protein-disulfide isomerase